MSTIAFFGDFFMDHGVYHEAERRDWPKSIRRALDYDLGVANFEGSLARTTPPRKQTILHMTPRSVDVLKEAGILAVCIANNHIGDGGAGSIVATRRFLESSGIQCFGGGANLREARKPALVQIGPQTIALLGYCSAEAHVGGIAATEQREGTAPLDVAGIAEDMRRVRCAGDVHTVVVYLHWGREYRRFPTGEERALALELRALGADFVIGTHPHVPRPYESTSHIFYSLGNFVFPEVRCVDGTRLRWDRLSRTGLCAIARMGEGHMSISPKPFEIDRHGLPLVDRNVPPSLRRLARAVEYVPGAGWMEGAALSLDDFFWQTRRFALWRWREVAAVASRRLRGKAWGDSYAGCQRREEQDWGD